MRLPLAAAAGTLARPNAAPPPPALAAAQKRVLVVDDNQDAAEILAASLGALGYVTEVAFDGPQALEVASAFRPQLAFLDIGLPVIDGYELARRMRAALGAAAVALVAITGYGRDKDRKRSATAGFADHLVKPVELARIAEVTARLLG